MEEMMRQNNDELPLACDLTAINAEEREHHIALTRGMLAAVQELRELPDGYGMRLPADMLLTAAEYISRERLCCPFFNFNLELEANGGALWLRMTGREGVKAFLQAELYDLIGQQPN
jgi:hypothetical protein